jgi:hypothetical protein
MVAELRRVGFTILDELHSNIDIETLLFLVKACIASGDKRGLSEIQKYLPQDRTPGLSAYTLRQACYLDFVYGHILQQQGQIAAARTHFEAAFAFAERFRDTETAVEAKNCLSLLMINERPVYANGKN